MKQKSLILITTLILMFSVGVSALGLEGSSMKSDNNPIVQEYNPNPNVPTTKAVVANTNRIVHCKSKYKMLGSPSVYDAREKKNIPLHYTNAVSGCEELNPEALIAISKYAYHPMNEGRDWDSRIKFVQNHKRLRPLDSKMRSNILTRWGIITRRWK